MDLDSSLAIFNQEFSTDSQMQRYIKLVVVVQVIRASDTSSFIVLMTAHRLHTKPQHTPMYMQLNGM